MEINTNPNTQDLDPLVVIDSLRNQLSAAGIEIAKRDALVNKLANQLIQQGQQINALSEAIAQQNASANGEVKQDAPEEAGVVGHTG